MGISDVDAGTTLEDPEARVNVSGSVLTTMLQEQIFLRLDMQDPTVFYGEVVEAKECIKTPFEAPVNESTVLADCTRKTPGVCWKRSDIPGPLFPPIRGEEKNLATQGVVIDLDKLPFGLSVIRE